MIANFRNNDQTCHWIPTAIRIQTFRQSVSKTKKKGKTCLCENNITQLKGSTLRLDVVLNHCPSFWVNTNLLLLLWKWTYIVSLNFISKPGYLNNCTATFHNFAGFSLFINLAKTHPLTKLFFVFNLPKGRKCNGKVTTRGPGDIVPPKRYAHAQNLAAKHITSPINTPSKDSANFWLLSLASSLLLLDSTFHNLLRWSPN